jgi:predicted TIM-barrel fold metal-dependent hydrolase
VPDRVIDTECHVAYRFMPIEQNPTASRVQHHTWHEHSGDLLVDEMDRAGVDAAILISYDAIDSAWFLERSGAEPEDFVTGRKYTLEAFRRHPERFWWFTTVKHPERFDALGLLKRDFSDGATGIKVFPPYLGMRATHPGLMDVYRLCAEQDRRVIFSFEDHQYPETPSLDQYFADLDEIAAEFSAVRFQINHGGCVEPLKPNSTTAMFYDVVDRHPNIWVSTSVLGMVWDDETEYPFPRYLSRLNALRDGIGPDRVMWATDWPWLEEFMKYPQAIDAVRKHADFLSEEEKVAVIGGNAMRFLP